MATEREERPFVKIFLEKTEPPCFGSGVQPDVGGDRKCRGCDDQECPHRGSVVGAIAKVVAPALIFVAGVYLYSNDLSLRELLEQEFFS